MRFTLLIGASIALSGCSTISDLRYSVFPPNAAEFSLAHQESAAKDITQNMSGVPRDKPLAFIENKSSSYAPAISALELRGYSVFLVDKTSDVTNGQLPVRYNLDNITDDDSGMAIAEIRIAQGLRVSRLYTDTGEAFIPASAVTMLKGEWDE